MNHLHLGDNLRVLRESIRDESVDLVYLDPPFNSNASYNKLFQSPDGSFSSAQIEAFDDTWHWGDVAESAYADVLRSGNTGAAEMLRAMRSFLGENDMMAYLCMMAPRLLELRRVMKDSATLYLHCDYKASHYLRMLLDAAFGANNFVSEIVWKRTFAHGSAQRWAPVHDLILSTSKTDQRRWFDLRLPHDPAYIEKHFRLVDELTGRRYAAITLTGSGVRSGESGRPWRGIDPSASGRHWALPGDVCAALGVVSGSVQERLDQLDEAGYIFWPAKDAGKPRLKHYEDALKGIAPTDVWTDIPPLSAHSKERLGYPTQKPVRLLERMIEASSQTGDVVLDPFCGCGTTVHAAQKLGRAWIGIDITHLAVNLIRRRLRDAFDADAKYEVHGVPTDLDGARALAEHDKHQFQLWAVSLIPDAQPWREGKKGADRGIDGVLYVEGDKGRTERCIISVKGGANVSSQMIRDLRGTIEREKAPMGLFVTLAAPSRDMVREAAAAGVWSHENWRDVPRIQILTIEQVLGNLPGVMPVRIPMARRDTYKKAARERGLDQGALDL